MGNSSTTVWDLPTRLFHWLLVTLVVLLWVSGEFGGLDVTLPLPLIGKTYLSNMDIHALAGQGVFILIVFRLMWGIWGSTTSRFTHFIRHPKAVLAEAKELLKGHIPSATGHNPIGGVMVVMLILVLLGQSLSGLFSSDDLFFEAPLAHLIDSDTSEMITGWHHRLFGILQVLIVLHISAIVYYLVRGDNLIKAMFTGRKDNIESHEVVIETWWKGIFSLLLAVLILVAMRYFS